MIIIIMHFKKNDCLTTILSHIHSAAQIDTTEYGVMMPLWCHAKTCAELVHI